MAIVRSITPAVLAGLLGITMPATDATEFRSPLFFIRARTQVDLAELSKLINQYVNMPEVPHV